jgi:hypothetical protein
VSKASETDGALQSRNSAEKEIKVGTKAYSVLKDLIIEFILQG